MISLWEIKKLGEQHMADIIQFFRIAILQVIYFRVYANDNGKIPTFVTCSQRKT